MPWQTKQSTLPYAKLTRNASDSIPHSMSPTDKNHANAARTRQTAKTMPIVQMRTILIIVL
jgi:hypothetical protein